MFELYLIRHGKTLANEKKLYCGSTDLELSPKGRKELNKIREIYAPCDIYFTSGMLRTNETLNIIYGENTEFSPLPSLKEINLGRFELKSHDELRNNKEYINWICDKSGSVNCPGGESRNAFVQRVSFGLLGLTGRIMQAKANIKENETVFKAACVTHGGVISTIMQIAFGQIKNFYDWQPEPGLGYKLTHDEESGYKHYEPIGF